MTERGVEIAPAGARVAVLCRPGRGQAAAGGVALALARALGAPCAVASAGGGGRLGSLGGTLAARRAAGRIGERDLSAIAAGRLVWLTDRRDFSADGDAAAAAASSAELARAAERDGAPAAIALPFARTAALDRVLAWHDAVVVVREPQLSEALVARALSSLAALGRPVAAMEPPARLGAALALAGLRAPAEAVAAVAQLGIGRRDV